MEVVNLSSAEATEMNSDVQRSSALKRKGLESYFGGNKVRSAEVIFRPGERTKLHAHDGIQILFVTGGKGIVGTEEKEEHVAEGDLIMFSRNEPHWHGSDSDSEVPFSHLYVIIETQGTTTKVIE